MTQDTMSTDRGKGSNAIVWILTLASAIADWLAVAAFLASMVKQDPILIFLMTVAAIAIAGIVYRVILRVRLVPVLVALMGSGVLVIIAWSLLASSPLTSLKVNITDPQDGENITMQYLVRGTVSDPDAKVYVIVHPLRVSGMWVQKQPIVDGAGNWQASANFGTETLGIGERYELIALAINDNFLVTWATGNSLSEGSKLTNLPRKTNRSNLITVTRPQ